jgi:hypothetical protein
VTVSNSSTWASLQTGGEAQPDVTGPSGSATTLRPTVTWTAVDGTTTYQVRLDDRTTRATNLFPGTATTGLSLTPPVDLVSGHAYRVWVRAVRGGVTGAWGTPGDFTVAVPTRQGPAGSLADLRPDFAWSGVSGVARYEIRVDDVSAGRTNIFPGTATTVTSWEPPADLVSGRSYRWRVRAVNADGLGTWGPAGTFTVARPTQTGPATGVTQLRPTFSWTAVTAATGYDIRAIDVSTGETKFKVRVSGTSWTPPADLISGRSYAWQVRAVNALGLGVWSPKAMVVIGRPTLTGPIGDTGNLRPMFTWTGITGSASYQVRVDDATTGRTRLFLVTVGGLSWTPPSDLTVGHAYRWFVRALNSAGLGVWTPAGTFRVV